MTSLAEDCCHNMPGGQDSWLDDQDHLVWELAFDISEWYEKQK